MSDSPLPTLGIPANATMTARVHDTLETAIIAGKLKPGERIHTDTLAAQFGMSRIPVREALRSLHEAGWVEIKPRHGVHVRERTAEELGELFEFRAVVEGLVSRWAARRRTDVDLDRLAACIAESKESTDDLTIGSQFYAAQRAAARNSVLAATSATLEKRARFYFSTVQHELGEDWLHVQGVVLGHIRDQDPSAAEQVARQHISDTGKAVAELLFSGSHLVRNDPPEDVARH